MNLSNEQLLTLDLLFRLTSMSVPASAVRLAERHGTTLESVRSDLLVLARRGLVDAERCRLTFAGLAIAAGRSRSAAPRMVRAA